jgi:hypothetical protein
MPDFDANDDPLRLGGAGRDDRFELPKLRPRFAPRSRALATRSCSPRAAIRARRIRPQLVARRWKAARRLCGERVMLPASPPRRRRRLWTTCQGRPPGSPS